jgi:dTDP-4-dehydrorhamnose 3,5-epimerase
MDKINIDGIVLTDLKIINHPKGDIYHGMKDNDIGYEGFGEAYFSTIKKNEIKGWKKHLEMTMNIIVPVGAVTFVLFDDRDNSNTANNFFSVKLSPNNYSRLTVAPGIWHAFKGHNHNLNLILDIADIKHQPEEIVRANLDDIPFEWKSL